MAKRFSLTALAGVLAAGLWGCASSERMSRMSGGIIQEYSAPRSKRIRSEKFQKHTKSQEKARHDLVGKVEETPVNIWPFFFSSEYYTAIMWPWIDWDEYGFAVRPFYNMEGDEHSVLFPLSAWNVKDRDGWVLLYSWDEDGFILFPLAARSETKRELFRYYTPLFIQKKGLEPPSIDREQSSFTEFMLGYYSSERRLDKGDWRELFRRDSLDDGLKRFLAYKLAGTGRAVPANKTGLEKLRKDVKMVAPLADDNGRSPFSDAGGDVRRNHRVALRVVCKFGDNVRELRRSFLVQRAGLRHERRRPHTDYVSKRRECVHLLCVDTVAHGAAFHFDDRMLSVLSDNRRRQS